MDKDGKMRRMDKDGKMVNLDLCVGLAMNEKSMSFESFQS